MGLTDFGRPLCSARGMCLATALYSVWLVFEKTMYYTHTHTTAHNKKSDKLLTSEFVFPSITRAFAWITPQGADVVVWIQHHIGLHFIPHSDTIALSSWHPPCAIVVSPEVRTRILCWSVRRLALAKPYNICIIASTDSVLSFLIFQFRESQAQEELLFRMPRRFVLCDLGPGYVAKCFDSNTPTRKKVKESEHDAWEKHYILLSGVNWPFTHIHTNTSYLCR